MSVFFTNMKTGVISSFVFFFVFYLVRIFVGTTGISSDIKVKASISPHTCISLIMDNILLFENEKVGMDFSNVGLMYNNYQATTGIAFLVFNIVLWLTLGIYLDQVFPNEFGSKRHPLFFLDCFFSKKQKTQLNLHEKDPENEKFQQALNDKVEKVDSQL